MLPDRVSNPGLLTYESGALPIALCGPAVLCFISNFPSIFTGFLQTGGNTNLLTFAEE